MKNEVLDLVLSRFIASRKLPSSKWLCKRLEEGGAFGKTVWARRHREQGDYSSNSILIAQGKRSEKPRKKATSKIDLITHRQEEVHKMQEKCALCGPCGNSFDRIKRVLTWHDGGDALSDRLHDTGTFVAKDDGERALRVCTSKKKKQEW